MPIISDGDLQAFSDLVESLVYKDTCDVLREGNIVTDTGGGYASNWLVNATLPCAVVDSSGSPATLKTQLTTAEQLSGKVLKQFLFPRGSDVLLTDRLAYDGQTYHVMGILDPTSFEISRRVSAEREEVGLSA